MKKTGALILLLLLCLFAAAFAFAEDGPVARNGQLAVYTDGEGHLYLPGRDEPINTTPAKGVVAIDAYRALFTAEDEALDARDLYMIDLESFRETRLVQGVYDACLVDEDTLYFVQDLAREQVTQLSLNGMTSRTAYTTGEPIERLYLSGEGLVVQLVDDAGAMLYVKETDQFVPYTGAVPRDSLLAESYELYLTDAGELYLKNDFNYTSELIDSDVTAWAQMDGVVYYLSRTGVALRLKAYDPATQTWRVVLTPGVRVQNQLTASDHALFMLTAENTVCNVDVKAGTMSVFRRYDDFTGYGLPEGNTVSGLRIEAMSGQLNVYAELEEAESKPDFSFITFDEEPKAMAPALRLIDTHALTGEESAWDLLKPAPQYAPLARGSRGDAVRAIQKPLNELGYYDYYVDGIFGPRTQHAVRLLQTDLDRPVTGVADAELQQIILSGRLSPYDPYLPLARGARGMRVQTMQERLRELGYLADAADGIFGPRTQKAVQLFQSENGLAVNDSATRETMRQLYSDAASRCSSYIDLYPGDTGYRVRDLNNRLKALYYLEESPGSAYTAQTTSAVRVFQRTANLRETGEATQAVQRALFATNAPEAPGYIPLRRGDDNDRVEKLQRRLQQLNYFDSKITGYFGKSTKDAVALFQKKVGLKATGEATVRTQQLLFAKDAPEYVPPTIIGKPVITLDSYDRLDSRIYFVSDESAANGYLTFSWEAEGDVESYNVRFTDANGIVYMDEDTLMEHTGVSVATLDTGVMYTLTVTAYPEDGDDDHITSDEISFVRMETPDEPEIGKVGTPKLSVDTVARVENHVRYLQPGVVTFHWHAEGDVESYFVQILDEGDEEVISASFTDEQASVRSGAMNAGEIYTLYVYAIPENGTLDDARLKTLRFCLPEIELPEADPTPVPTPQPTPEPTLEPTEAPAVEAPEEIPEPVPTADIPVEETPEPTEAPTPEPAWVSEPEISFDNAVLEADGVSYVEGDNITIRWSAEGGVSGYEVELTDANGTLIGSTSTTDTSTGLNAAAIRPGDVYTLYVTAVPEGGTKADGALASARFTVYTAPEATEAQPTEVPYIEPVIEDPVPEPEPEPVIEEPAVEPEPEPVIEEPAAEPEPEPVIEEPAAEPEPVVEEPAVEPEPEPVIEEPVTQPEPEPVVEEPVAEPEPEPVIEEPAVEPESEPVVEEPVAEPEPEPTEEPTPEPTEEPTPEPTEEPTPEPTEEPTPEPTEEPTPEPTEEPTPEPTEEPTPEPTEEPTPEPTEEPTPEPTEEPTPEPEPEPVDYTWDMPIDAYSDANQIAAIQARLMELGWLKQKGDLQIGVLDERTVTSVSMFQDYVNESFGMALAPIDPDMPVIDIDTLDVLMNTYDDTYMKPE